MSDGSLTFAIPVRDPKGVGDWAMAKRLISVTITSLLAQHGPTPTVVLGVTPGTDLPSLPPEVMVVDVDLPYAALPAGEGPARWVAIRTDKGLRLAHALAAVRPQGHVMVVDYDDLVSTRLTSLVADQPDAAGWFVDSGYLWDGGPLASVWPKNFHELCGTSLIIRADLMRIAADPTDPEQLEWIQNTLGSHKMWRGLFPLEALPFPGAVYRIGSGDNASGAGGLARRIAEAARRPRQLPGTLGALRPWGRVKAGFGA